MSTARLILDTAAGFFLGQGAWLLTVCLWKRWRAPTRGPKG